MWITKHTTEIRQRNEKRQAFCLTYGAELPLRGTYHKLIAKEGTQAGFDGEAFYMPPELDNETIKQAVIAVYKSLAKHILTKKTAAFARIMNVNPSGVKINSAKGRWGSCNGKGGINFSWRLIMMDDKLIDYVIVHELSHILHHDHSANFWKTLQHQMPDYELRRKELKLSSEEYDIIFNSLQ